MQHAIPQHAAFSQSSVSSLCRTPVTWCTDVIQLYLSTALSPVATDKAPRRNCTLAPQAASHCSHKRTELSERARIKTPLCQIKTTTTTRTELRVLVYCTDHFALFASLTRCLFAFRSLFNN